MPANEDDLMTVGELARRVGVTVRTIQYYDQKGLLHPSSKSEQNQRLYSRDDEERLYRILTLKYLGFSLAQIKEAEALDDRQELSGALEHRMHELERESVEVLRNISTVNSLREHLAASEHVRWSDFAQAISDMQNREDVLWLAINGEGCDESSVPELTHEEVSRWHQLMGDTIEAMHDGVQPGDERGRELALRFERLGDILGGHRTVKTLVRAGRRIYFYLHALKRRRGFLRFGSLGLYAVLFGCLTVLYLVHYLGVCGDRQLLREKEVARVSVRYIYDLILFALSFYVLCKYDLH